MNRLTQILAPIVLLSAVGLTGCGKSDAACSVDADCFRGEVCSDEDVCIADPDATNNDDNSDPTGEDGGDSDQTGSDAGDSNSDGGPNADTSDPVEGVCVIDPFTATCDVPDDNDSFGDYIRFEPEPPGCESTGNEFTGGETTFEGGQICHNETRDRYNTNLVPCDDITYVIEATLVPKQDCNPDHYTLGISAQGNSCEEPNDLVRCEDLGDGRKRVTAMISPSISIASPTITIEKTVQDLKFDYDLELVVRQ